MKPVNRHTKHFKVGQSGRYMAYINSIQWASAVMRDHFIRGCRNQGKL